MPKRGSIELRAVGSDERAPSGLVASDATDLANRQKRQTLGCLGASVVVLGLAGAVASNADAGYSCDQQMTGMPKTGWNVLDCAPVSTRSEEPLRQAFRPPRRTEAQAAAMTDIQANAARESAAAKDWVLGYIASDAVRGRLDSSLQHYTDAQLLDMWVWEMERMAVWHNAPLDAAMVEQTTVCHDDTPLNITLENGSVPSPRCLFSAASFLGRFCRLSFAFLGRF